MRCERDFTAGNIAAGLNEIAVVLIDDQERPRVGLEPDQQLGDLLRLCALEAKPVDKLEAPVGGAGAESLGKRHPCFTARHADALVGGVHSPRTECDAAL